MVKRKKKATDRPKIGHRPRKWTDLELFQERIKQFFAECDASKRPYTITGLAMAVGLARQNLLKYEDERPGFSESVKAAKERIQRWVEESLLEGGRAGKNTVGLIFWLKNNASWADTLQLAGPDGEPLGAEMSSLEVAARVVTILELAKRKREEQDAGTAQKQIPEKIGHDGRTD